MTPDPRVPRIFYERISAPYYLYAPPFTQKSAGVRMLHYLCHTLNALGYEAYVATAKTSPRLHTPQLTQEIMETHHRERQTPIVVYAEVYPGNPLALPVVVRWLLNKTGLLCGHTDFASDELTFYWDEWVLEAGQKEALQATRLFFPPVDRSVFNDKGVAPGTRRGICYYARKYLESGYRLDERLIREGISLCHDIPRSKEEIAEILRACKVFYCYEPTAMIAEAQACGCFVALVETDYLRQFRQLPQYKIRAEALDLGFEPPPVNQAAFERGMAKLEQEAFASVLRFIDITQAAARAKHEADGQPAARLARAIAVFAAQRADEAADLLFPLLEELPGDPLPAVVLACISAQRGLVREAEAFIQRARELAPQRHDFLAMLGETFLKHGQPEQALLYLRQAVERSPELFSAYPALAQSLARTGHDEEAVSLLNSAAAIPSSAQADIRSFLLELLAQQGDADRFIETCLRFASTLADDLFLVRNLARVEESGEILLETLGRIQEKITPFRQAQSNMEENGDAPRNDETAETPLKIAFLVGDFTREARLGRLSALLAHLPPETFLTQLVLTRAPDATASDFAQGCLLLADDTLSLHAEEDASALPRLRALGADILIDLDAYGMTERLPLFTAAQAARKFIWGETPLPPLMPDTRALAGEALNALEAFPGLALPGLGECLVLPELPLSAPSPETARPPLFGCLTPLLHIARAGWELFAEILKQQAASRLVLNLAGLGEAAANTCRARFARAGVAPERLSFTQAEDAESLCRQWRHVDLGLAPPVDTGGLALPTCLWMGKPYVALASALPWGQRPAALLAAAGASGWIAATPEDYIARTQTPPPAPNPAFRAHLKATGLTDPKTFAQGFAERILRDWHNRHS
ncbi:MAG: hypothetical protein LBR88_08415 [Zoogloeaceae bacterium]|jgi:predicted O-linked N-acetylglucosamine transferase (SPINDLY family)|nr:hypothetical protein [Zoogloeaceae bacterium]